ncbi:hypothetical protein [Nitrosomonas communis]|uniref:Uncharacterized protein n=1 Tax=Nitrosomonas communis TaxID=44574 RepID=A0A1I4NA97_9PROT|nr:hypothetical protein [Nitrosomonas communis]SFM12464.1 hypothetical protein SAMN05421863_10149 [Nitrosomonas communis]
MEIVRLGRLCLLFYPFSIQFTDVNAILRVLLDLHPKLGTKEESYKIVKSILMIRKAADNGPLIEITNQALFAL